MTIIARLFITLLFLVSGRVSMAQTPPEAELGLSTEREPASCCQSDREMVTTTIQTPSFVASFKAPPRLILIKSFLGRPVILEEMPEVL
jgi:hypothetical protein